MTSIILAALILLPSFCKANQCSFTELTKDCEVLKKRETEQFITFPDGTLLRNPAYDLSGWRTFVYTSHNYGVPSKARKEHVQRLFQTTKENLISHILRGRSEVELTPAERSQLTRVKSVSFFEAQNNECPSFKPSAGYSSEKHAFTICPSAMNQPDSQLAFAIGHEIGHSLDACAMQLPLLKNFEAGQARFQIDARPILGRPAIKAGGKIEALGFPDGHHPQQNLIECLNEKKATKSMSVSDEQTLANELGDKIAKGLSETEKKRPENGLAHLISAQRDIIKNYPHCFSAGRLGSNTNEFVSDYWGSISLAHHLEKHPPKTDLDRVAIFSIFLKDLCKFGGAAKQDEKPLTPGEISTHPSSIQRANLVVLANPKLAQILNCSPISESCGQNQRPSGLAPKPGARQ